MRRARRLALAGRVLLVAASVPLLLRLGLDRTARVLEPRRSRPEASPAHVDDLVTTVEAVLRRGRPLVRPGCLTRGLTHFYFLRRAGVDVALVFGMGRPEDDWEGHCWLVRDGRPFLERTDPRPHFAETYRIPAGAPARL